MKLIYALRNDFDRGNVHVSPSTPYSVFADQVSRNQVKAVALQGTLPDDPTQQDIWSKLAPLDAVPFVLKGAPVPSAYASLLVVTGEAVFEYPANYDKFIQVGGVALFINADSPVVIYYASWNSAITMTPQANELIVPFEFCVVQ